MSNFGHEPQELTALGRALLRIETMSIESAVKQSVESGQIVAVDYEGSQCKLLAELGMGDAVDFSDDFVGGKPVLDIWSTDGPEWRLNVTLILA